MKNETYRELLTRFNENFEGIHRVLVAFEVQNYLQSFEIKLSEEDFEDLYILLLYFYFYLRRTNATLPRWTIPRPC